jgi:hypothetical protein
MSLLIVVGAVAGIALLLPFLLLKPKNRAMQAGNDKSGSDI